MRKFVLFLLVFGAAFALLWSLSRKSAPPGGQVDEQRDGEPGPEARGPFTEIPASRGGTDDPQRSEKGPIGIRLSGAIDITQTARLPGTTELRPEIVLKSKDVSARTSDVYDMRGVSILVLDPPTGRQRADLKSPLSTVRIAIEDGLPRVSSEEPVRMTDADVTLFEGGPVVPLRVRVPALDWTWKDGRFRSAARVRADGRGLVAEGTGFDAATSESRFELTRDAWIELTLADGRTARLSSGKDGSIVLQRVERADGEFVDLVADEGAALDVRTRLNAAPGTEAVPVSIRARRIHVLGRKVGAGDVYEIASADAHEEVVSKGPIEELRAQTAEFSFGANGRLTHASFDRDVQVERARAAGAALSPTGQNDSFRSGHAEFDFDAAGQLVSATLTGEPTADVHVGRFVAGQRPEFAGETARIAGQGPLVVTRTDGDTLDFAGPARLEIPGRGFLLKASERIVGREDPVTRHGQVSALGSVELEQGVNRLTSDGLVLDWFDSAGLPGLLATTKGVTVVDAQDERGRTSHTVARGGLTTHAVRQDWIVEHAVDVEITTSEPAVAAKARNVRNLDPRTGRFEADGDVRLDTPRGIGRAERMTARGRDDVTLLGSDAAPATFEFEGDAAGSDPRASGPMRGRLRASRIDARPERVVAEGTVSGYLETVEGRLDVAGGLLEIDLEPENAAQPAAPRAFRAHMARSARATIHGDDVDALVTGDDVVVNGVVRPAAPGVKRASLQTTDVRADGSVHVDHRGKGGLVGDGDHFTLDEKGLGRLWADAGRRVSARGKFAGAAMPYAVEADWVEFDREHVEASEVRMRLDESAAEKADVQARDASAKPGDARAEPAVAVAGVASEAVYHPIAAPGATQDPGDGMPARLNEFRARRVRVDRHEVLLTGAAHVDGATRQGEEWLVEAETIRLRGEFQDTRRLRREDVLSVDAEGGFLARLGRRMSARGESMNAVPGRVRIVGAPAQLELLSAEWQSTSIEYDLTNMLLSTDTGTVRARIGSPGASWSIDYESMQPFDQDDDTILVLRNPRVRFASLQMRADWMLFWVDRDQWRKSGLAVVSQAVEGDPLRVTATAPAEQAAPVNPNAPFDVPDLLAEMRNSQLFRVLSEAYVEGNIEFFDQGERTGRAQAVYLDVKDQQGWIQEADVSVDVSLRGFDRKLRAKAKWMRIAPGPVLHAQDAEITSCDYDTPHYVIETSNLRMTPKRNVEDQRVAFDVSARGNSLRFESGFRLPLPPLVYETDAEGKPLVDRFVLGNSAKYGAAVQATLNAELGPIGTAAGKAIANVLRIPDADIRGNWRYNVGILGSRGVLLGMGLDLRAGDSFKMLAEVDGIPDRRSDRGLVRVEEEDRSLLRTWFRTRARYTTRPGEWFDLALSSQSDPGVQSEFFEREYLRYERKDNYLHWRKATEDWYLNASAKVRFDDRRDVEELPSAGVFMGRTPLATWFETPIYYDGRADFAYLRRHDGDARYYRPFEDGLGDRDVRRFDTEHRLEAPFDLGVLQARGTPYVRARGTLWSEGADPDAEPHRLALIAGFDATTTFWKRFESGSIHTITPSIGVHQDLLSEESTGELVRIDQVEDPIEGRFFDFGVRSRWWRPDTIEKIDVDVRASYGSQLPDGQRSGLQPLAVLGELLTYKGDVPIGVTHDGRYDTHSGNTTYSLTSVGFEPWENVGVELGYQRGLSTIGQSRLFESASVAARWRWTTKWEFEFGQSYAIASDTGVGNSFVLRRLGHDFVVELEAAFRSGEGSTLAINFQPAIAWRRSGLGLLDRWLGVYH